MRKKKERHQFEFKDLGILFDTNLNFCQHIDNINLSHIRAYDLLFRILVVS